MKIQIENYDKDKIIRYNSRGLFRKEAEGSQDFNSRVDIFDKKLKTGLLAQLENSIRQNLTITAKLVRHRLHEKSRHKAAEYVSDSMQHYEFQYEGYLGSTSSAGR